MPPARARGRAASRQTAGNRRCEPRSRRETSSFPRRSTPWEASRSPLPGRNRTARRRSDRHSAPSATPSSGSRQLWHRRTMLSPLWFRLCRLRDFGLRIDNTALKDLNRIRTDIEHYCTDESRETVREAIAKAFPVVVDLFHLAEETPHEVLGEAWQTMLEVRTVYEKELATC